MKKNLAIVLAGGTGSRTGESLPKQFLLLRGKPILLHTLEKFELHPQIHHIFLVTHRDYIKQTKQILEGKGFTKLICIMEGGEARQDSSRIGVMAADPNEYENILIHDGARPFLSGKIIDEVLAALNGHSAVNVAVETADTILVLDEKNYIKDVPDRKTLRRVQTPQGFKTQLIREAHQKAMQEKLFNSSDDCLLVSRMRLSPVYVVDGSPLNIKITYPVDLLMADKILDIFIYN